MLLQWIDDLAVLCWPWPPEDEPGEDRDTGWAGRPASPAGPSDARRAYRRDSRIAMAVAAVISQSARCALTV